MADKNENEILEEQRRAREEFLKLKKMQSGEIDAGPKPSEVAVVPKTFKEKSKNFWFHYKWHTIGIIFTVIALTVLVVQCASKPKYDLEIVYFTYTPAIDYQLEGAAAYFESKASDVNGDGEVKISVVNCSLSGNSGDVQYRNTVLTKIQAMLLADEKAMLFITDEDSIEYFDNISEDMDLFEETVALGEDFYTATATEEYGSLPEGLNISCRQLTETMLDQNKDSDKTYEASMEVLEKIKSVNE